MKHSQLSKSSKEDLASLREELQFVSEFDIELHEAIEFIDRIQKMDWEQIEELRKKLSPSHSSSLDYFCLRVIDRYCSNND